jgi:hypothetical protein
MSILFIVLNRTCFCLEQFTMCKHSCWTNEQIVVRMTYGHVHIRSIVVLARSLIGVHKCMDIDLFPMDIAHVYSYRVHIELNMTLVKVIYGTYPCRLQALFMCRTRFPRILFSQRTCAYSCLSWTISHAWSITRRIRIDVCRAYTLWYVGKSTNRFFQSNQSRLFALRLACGRVRCWFKIYLFVFFLGFFPFWSIVLIGLAFVFLLLSIVGLIGYVLGCRRPSFEQLYGNELEHLTLDDEYLLGTGGFTRMNDTKMVTRHLSNGLFGRHHQREYHYETLLPIESTSCTRTNEHMV